MADFSKESEIVITCPKNIVPYLSQEVEALGYKILHADAAFVRIKGSLDDCMVLNLWLRTAHKVLYKVWDFYAPDPDSLYKEIYRIPWEHLIDDKGYFTVTSQVFNDNIRDTRFANLKVKDAIADKIKDRKGNRPDSGPAKDKTVVFLHWDREKATVFLDTSGETIAKHGYRRIPGKAPMQETLAAAVIMAGRWKPGQIFINPMCGSGTLGIEAALIAANKAPGLLRDEFGFMHIIGFADRKWNALLAEARRKMVLPQNRFLLSDIDPEAVKGAKINASMAGLDKVIEFEVADFREIQIPEGEEGVIIMNPEYGERLGDEAELETTYKEIGDFFKKDCKGYTGYVFTGNIELGKKVGLKPKRRIPFFNGPIECRLFEYELYSGTRRIIHSES
jgi:putative N6-adenine-specific DNA methylase